MLNIVIPMAGRGSRFQQAGYQVPKPLIPVGGVPMIQLVIANLRPQRAHRFIFIVLKEMLHQHDLEAKLRAWAPDCLIQVVDQVTEGAACTVLLTREWINSADPLMIANCDQWVDIDINDYLASLDSGPDDGLIMTMWADHPKWSYARLENGRVVEVVEKQVVSNEATVGIYNFRAGSQFVAAAEQMIARNFRVNGEFYVAPVYNDFLRMGKSIRLFNIGKEAAGMYGLGIPEDLQLFETYPVCQKAVALATQGGQP